MEIKETNKLKPGDVIKLKIDIESLTDYKPSHRHELKTIECVCTQVFTHHAMFRMLVHPHREFSISNAQLYQAGIYTENDAVNVFVRR